MTRRCDWCGQFIAGRDYLRPLTYPRGDGVMITRYLCPRDRGTAEDLGRRNAERLETLARRNAEMGRPS